MYMIKQFRETRNDMANQMFGKRFKSYGKIQLEEIDN